MSPIVVVDAGVALEWAVREEHSDQAAALLHHYERGRIVGPPHLTGEVTDAV